MFKSRRKSPPRKPGQKRTKAPSPLKSPPADLALGGQFSARGPSSTPMPSGVPMLDRSPSGLPNGQPSGTLAPTVTCPNCGAKVPVDQETPLR